MEDFWDSEMLSEVAEGMLFRGRWWDSLAAGRVLRLWKRALGLVYFIVNLEQQGAEFFEHYYAGSEADEDMGAGLALPCEKGERTNPNPPLNPGHDLAMTG